MSKTKAQLQDELSDALYLVDKYKALFEDEVRIHINSCHLSMERFARINELEDSLQLKKSEIFEREHEIHDLKVWIHCVRGLDCQGNPFPDVKGGS